MAYEDVRELVEVVAAFVAEQHARLRERDQSRGISAERANALIASFEGMLRLTTMLDAAAYQQPDNEEIAEVGQDAKQLQAMLREIILAQVLDDK